MSITMTLIETPLKANQRYTSPIMNTMEYIFLGAVKAFIISNVQGTFFYEESDDMRNWVQTKTFDIQPNVIKRTGILVLSKQFFRFRYINGPIEQKRFKVILNFVDPDASDSGSGTIVKTVKDARYGTGNSSFILNEPCTRVAIDNPGSTPIVVSVEGINIKVQPYGTFEDDFEPFTNITITAEGEWSILFKS